MIRASIVALVIFTVVGVTSIASAGCTGNACGAIEIRKRSDGCVVLVNNSAKRIAVQVINYTYHVYAHSEEVPTDLGNRCWTGINNWIANYEE